MRRRRRDDDGEYLRAYVRFADGTSRLVIVTWPPAPKAITFYQAPGDQVPLLQTEITETGTKAVREVHLLRVDRRLCWYQEPVAVEEPAAAPGAADVTPS